MNTARYVAFLLMAVAVAACGAGKAVKPADPLPLPKASPTAYVGQQRKISAIDKMELVAVNVNAVIWAQTKAAKEQSLMQQYGLDPRFEWTVDYETGVFVAVRVAPVAVSGTAR